MAAHVAHAAIPPVAGSIDVEWSDGLLKKHGVFFSLTLEDVQKDSDAALASSR